jgi:transposase
MEEERKERRIYEPQSKKYYATIIHLHYGEGKSCREISKIIHVSRKTASRMIANFATAYGIDKGLNMSTGEKSGRTSGKRFMELKSELEETRKKLAEEELRADAYEEMIRIADERFGIDIRKKHGAKQ